MCFHVNILCPVTDSLFIVIWVFTVIIYFAQFYVLGTSRLQFIVCGSLNFFAFIASC